MTFAPAAELLDGDGSWSLALVPHHRQWGTATAVGVEDPKEALRLLRTLASELGADPAVWLVWHRLGADHAGSLGDLAVAVRGVSADPHRWTC